MSNRAQDWYTQALYDLEMAQEAVRSQRHEWACFAAQQRAEKAVKALHLCLGQEAWGHVVARLLEDLLPHVQVPADLIDRAKVLDTYYIPTRYPNSHAAGAPHEHYTALQSEEAIRYARAIVEFVRDEMARCTNSAPGDGAMGERDR